MIRHLLHALAALLFASPKEDDDYGYDYARD